MPDSAVLNETARVLKLVQSGTPADAALRETLGRTRHSSAPGLRREVSRAVFAYFRWWRWLDGKQSLQKQVEAARELQTRFDRAPTAFKPEALAARAVPEWTLDEIPWPLEGAAPSSSPLEGAAPSSSPLEGAAPSSSPLEGAAPSAPRTSPSAAPAPRPSPSAAPAPSASRGGDGAPPSKTSLSATATAWLRQLQREPALWIRVKQEHAASVTSALGDCIAADHFALRNPQSAFRYSGTRDLFLTAAFQAGRFEIQDLASQLVGHACAPQPGQTWWDACAGEGGKTMHLSDLMQNKGMIWASDRSSRRLAHLKKRASRAEVFNYRAAPWDGSAKLPTKTKFDGVLVDAPCSGVGTWQRNPHARWTTSPHDVRELAAVQQRLLDHAAPALKSGGRLVYSVCTLTRAETTAIAEQFGAAHPEFEPAPVFPHAQPAALRSPHFLWPHDLDANGMFIAAWEKK